MTSKSPQFKIGNKISPWGTPSSTYMVTNVETNSNNSGNFYLLETPDGVESRVPTTEVDGFFSKNARLFNKQVEALNKEPEDPEFDEQGMPTFIYENMP